MKKLGFNIVLLGMIASGKDTQANILKKEYSLRSVESGAYWRKLLKEKSKDGEWVRRTMGKGKPAPVALMKKFLVREIANKPKNKDLLFVGNPRLKPEAQLLKKLFNEKKENFLCFYIALTEKEALNRSASRQRDDDDKIYLHRRIAWHKDQVGKTVKYFQSLNKMKIINGNQPIAKVSKDILKEIEKFKGAN